MPFDNRVHETTITAGAGPITLLGAVFQRKSFAAGFGLSGVSSIGVTMVHKTSPEWQTGYATLGTDGRLTFDVIEDSSAGGSQLVFSAGLKDIFCDVPASFFNSTTPVTPAPGTVQLSAATYSVGEGGGTVTVTVTRTGGSSGVASVAYATSNGTATAGADYTATSGTLTWADADAAPKTFAVPIINDSAVESNETFNVTLSVPTGAALGSLATSVVTITDNDSAAVAPSAPTGVTATAGNASATVTGTPGSNGGSAVTGYTATSSPGGFTGSGSSLPVTVSGLTNGTAYTFTLTATNTVGTSSASSPSAAVTPSAGATVPGAPTSVVATAGNASASVAFTAPASNGGSAITGYLVTASTGQTASGSASPINVTGLANGTAVTFTVHAINAVGNSVESAASAAVTPTVSVDTRPGFFLGPIGSTPAGIVAGRTALTSSTNGGKTGGPATFTTTAGQYVFFAVATAAGTPVFHDNNFNFNGGFSSFGTVTDGNGTAWTTYKSDNANAYPSSAGGGSVTLQ